MKKYFVAICIVFVLDSTILFAFDNGFVLGLKANFSGSITDPHISKEDTKTMGADYLKGGVGFIVTGELDLTYIFDAKKYFNRADIKKFGGLGLGFYIGVGQGFSGQESGIPEASVFVNVYFTPVIHFGTSLKTYLASNRFILGCSLGGRLIADPTPTYDMYNSNPDLLKDIDGTGTMIVTKDMMKKMNPLGFTFKGFMEYVQPVMSTTELVLGAYTSYCVYKPGYVSMPEALAKTAKESVGFDANNTKLKSFFLNSFDFGLTLGINFKVNP